MKRKSLIFVFILLLLSVGGVLVWRDQHTRARAEKLESQILKGLSASDLALVLKSQALSDPQVVTTMKEVPAARQDFLRNLKGVLALAAQARREGLAEDPNFKINLEYKSNALLQALYTGSKSREELKRMFLPEDFKAVWNTPENEGRFLKDIETLKAIQEAYNESRQTHTIASSLNGEKLDKTRKEWAATKVISDRAKADADFFQQPEIALRLRILEAGILSSAYLTKHWRQKIRATEAEITDYLAVHPEFDISKKRRKAEELLQRVKAGEDIGKLAAEHSEDRPTKIKNGLYENVERNVLWAEVESAALSMKEGEVADKVIESDVGFHVVKSEGKSTTKEKDGTETVRFSVRHILLQKAFEEPNNRRPDIPPPFMKAEEIAKAEVEKQKYDVLVAELIGLNGISLPDDFQIDMTENSPVEPKKGSPVGVNKHDENRAERGSDSQEK